MVMVLQVVKEVMGVRGVVREVEEQGGDSKYKKDLRKHLKGYISPLQLFSHEKLSSDYIPRSQDVESLPIDPRGLL